MGRAPCCAKIGLKKGPWTSEEDRILINHINTYGHSNWRALPKQAGLLRCGKSCRLRWNNYLRPDIKRGNFTKEEEDAIINLHHMLGNRWSAIAAKLPGRTDNEIKNVWHTHLKKRLPQNQRVIASSTHLSAASTPHVLPVIQLLEAYLLPVIELLEAHGGCWQQKGGVLEVTPNQQGHNSPKRNNKKQPKLDVDSKQDAKQEHKDDDMPQSPPQSSCDTSSLTTGDNNHKHSISSNDATNNHDTSINNNDNYHDTDSSENNLALDEDFWSEVLSSDNSNETSGVLDIGIDGDQFQVPFSPLGAEEGLFSASSLSMCNDMGFWHDVYARAEEITELLEL